MPSPGQRLTTGSIAGLAAAIAYAVEQEFDLRAFDHNTDDLTLLGRMVTGDDQLIRPVGLAMHLANGAAVGTVYALFLHERLPGPPVVRSLTFLMAETAALYPLAVFEKHHPGIREGRLDSYLTGTGFAQQVARHVAFGAVLGPLTARLLRR